jgi:ABC-type sugar transport system permease subunit
MTTKTERGGLSRYGGEFRDFLADTWLGYAFMLPATVLLGAIVIYPTLRAVYLSFFQLSLLAPNQTTFVGLQHFFRMASDPEFWMALKNSIIVTGVSVALEYLLGLGLALTLKEKLPTITWFRSVTMVPWVLPVVVMVIIFRFLVQPDFGFVNIILEAVGLPTSYWFGDPLLALPLIILMHVWRSMPFFAIALMAGMQAIPGSLYEAAEMDGAGSLEQFRYITLPQLSTISMIMIVLHVIFTFNNFDMVYLSTGGGPLNATEVLPTYIYKQAFSSYALGYAASIGVVMLVLLLVFTIIYVRLEDLE